MTPVFWVICDMSIGFISFLIPTEKKKELCVVTVHKGPTNKDSGL